MHEANFTEQIVSSIIGELKNHPDSQPKRIRIRVGEMFHLNCESVLFHYHLLTNGTNLAGVDVELEEEPVKVLCHACQKIDRVEDHHLLMCSHCQSMDVEMTSGNAIFTEFVEEAEEKLN